MDDDDLPMDTSREVFYFNEGALAYAGHYLHAEDNPPHTHSFVEIAFAIGGAGTHHCVAGRRELSRGDVVLLRPGVWHGYEDCRRPGAVQLLLQQRAAAPGTVLDPGGPAARLPALDRALRHGAAGDAGVQPAGTAVRRVHGAPGGAHGAAALPAGPVPGRHPRPPVAPAQRARAGPRRPAWRRRAQQPARWPARSTRLSGRRYACWRPTSPGTGRSPRSPTTCT